MRGTDYSAIEAAIEHVETTIEESGPARPTPPGWPAQVLPPDDPGWVHSATSWLLDILPPDYRTHSEIITKPRALAWMAATHVEHYQAAAQRGYRSAAVDLRMLAATGYDPEDVEDLVPRDLDQPPPNPVTGAGPAERVEPPTVWGVVVTCDSEAEQVELLERLSAEGHSVRALM
ncbi:hypothetical protein ETD86_48050 [Nonomuraea turkmeniaca]|uniref:Uncharacterized protein n=1 Tax=Nonomuraea turkmeniaca TaxID=103838 RepID=A0A5S4EY01_9ACTN|nr:hypothetical protein [Nonomuraea turkmeniaca]TMR08389.1 hypothetical protein ETD86_48050 [Nonomuraea turkmeniaca]